MDIPRNMINILLIDKGLPDNIQSLKNALTIKSENFSKAMNIPWHATSDISKNKLNAFMNGQGLSLKENHFKITCHF